MSACQSKAICTTNGQKVMSRGSRRLFDKLVSVGNVKAAIRLVTDHDGGQCLPLDSIQPDGRSVKEHLLDEHPPGAPAPVSAISNSPPVTEPHPIIFDCIDGPLIRFIAQKTDGSWTQPRGNVSAPSSKVHQ